MKNIGSLILSFDVELAWGAIENGRCFTQDTRGLYDTTQRCFMQLLKLFGAYEIPATFAFVGGLLEKNTQEISLEHLSREIRDRIYHALTHLSPQAIYGGKMLEAVMKSKMPHEVACHAYSHTRYNRSVITEKTARSDVMLCKASMDKTGIPCQTFIFPRNEVEFEHILPDYGFFLYRSPDHNWGNRNRNKFLSRLGGIIDIAGLGTPPAAEIMQSAYKLMALSGSLFFHAGRRKQVLLPLLERRALRGLRKAEQLSLCLHIWAHPFNFAESEIQLQYLGNVLQSAVRKREKGTLQIVTMAEFARQHDEYVGQ